MSWDFFNGVGRVWARQATSERVLDAYREATGGKANNHGAVFVAALKQHGSVGGRGR
jgi:hypothetical protein